MLLDERKRAAYDRTLGVSQSAPQGGSQNTPHTQAAPKRGPPVSQGHPFAKINLKLFSTHTQPNFFKEATRNISITVRHSVTKDEVNLRVPMWTSIYQLKEAIVKEVKRGPISQVELSQLTPIVRKLGDNEILREGGMTVLCNGISFGRPELVQVQLVCREDSRFNSSVEAFDTWQVRQLRDAAAKNLNRATGRVLLAELAQDSSANFQSLADDAFLFGRSQLRIQVRDDDLESGEEGKADEAEEPDGV
mmetsp:Transcript_74665/g.136426  ORF Transcript_74665/g.136426 Transcript_74665/m.136426 type:complete len:249 (-) Transcript_74665:82-828(-)